MRPVDRATYAVSTPRATTMLVSLGLIAGCARGPDVTARPDGPAQPNARASASPYEVTDTHLPSTRVEPSVELDSANPPVPAEAALGVLDRGVYSDLDAKLQLPAPSLQAELSAVIDSQRAILVVYADHWPHKVYPLGGPVTLRVGSERLALRPGDARELAGKLRHAALRRLGKGEVAPPGDWDEDGIPDPLDVLIGAEKAILAGASYDDGYFPLKYPGGDPPRNRGACVDVIVRAVRNAGVDLQRAVIEDERVAGTAYGVAKPDSNIDHRRVRNAVIYFSRHWTRRGNALGDPGDPLRPGDVVFLDTFPDRPGPDHVGVLAQSMGKSGHPLVVNLWTFGYETQAMDLLEFVPVTHRFRFPSRRP